MLERNGSAVQSIVLAGTHPWREPGFAAGTPRVLMPVAQTPLIYYSLRWLRDAGITRATICANSATEPVRQFLGDGAPFGMHIGYFEDESPRGAAGCIRDAAEQSGGGTLVIVDGTAIPDIQLEDLLDDHKSSGAAITVAVRETVGEDSALHPLGIYVFDRAAVDEIPPAGFQDIKEALIPRLHRAAFPVVARSVRGECRRVLGASSYLAVNLWMVTRILSERSQTEELTGYVRRGEALIHPSATVDANAILLGPIIVGPSVQVSSGAALVGPTVIGADVSIGAGAVISRSVVWRRCAIEAEAHVDGCVLADECIVKSGTAIVGVAPPSRGRTARPLPASPHFPLWSLKPSALTARLRSIRTRVAQYS